MKDQLPVRTFTVVRSAGPSITVLAHAPQFDGGTLIFMRYGGDHLWPVAVFAAGAWSSVAVELPSEADLQVYTTLAREGEAQKRAASSVLVPQLGRIQ